MVRVLIPLSLLSAATAFQTIDTHDHLDYSGMKTAMINMAKHIQEHGINDATTLSINGMLDIINNKLVPALNQDRDAAQNSLNASKAVVNKCNTDRTTWADGALVGLNGDVDSEDDAHNACRRQEHVTYTNYTSHCSKLQNRVCSWGEDCTLPSFAAGDTDAVDTYICCLQSFFALHRPDYYDELENCNTATSLHHAQVAKCDKAQNDFQDEFCSRENAIQQKCKWYDQCRCSSETEYESVKADVEALEKIFQTQFVALQHLDCYGRQMLQNITDLSGCNDVGDDCEAQYPGTCPEIIYAPEPEAFIPCDEPHANHPCQDDFKAEFFGWLSNQTCTPIEECGANYCENKDITDGTYTGGRKQGYAECGATGCTLPTFGPGNNFCGLPDTVEDALWYGNSSHSIDEAGCATRCQGIDGAAWYGYTAWPDTPGFEEGQKCCCFATCNAPWSVNLTQYPTVSVGCV